jgi:hypothetical protein
VALATVALLLGACSPPRALEAGRVLADIAAGAEPSALKRATAAPLRVPVIYRIAGRDHNGDLYRPAEGADAALVLVPGVTPTGKDDPRLVAFAKTLARARFLVLVPEIEAMRVYKVGPDNARDIADAVKYLAGRMPAAEGAAVGLIAISYAVGPALLAALEPDTGALVRFVGAVGGYYDIEAVVTFFTTGRYRAAPDAPWDHREPNAYGKWVFVGGNVERLSDPADRATLSAIAERKLDDLDADIDDLAGRLGSEGRAVHALVVNDDPERVPTLIAGLPEAMRADMAALDLKRRDLSQLAPRLILVHGRDDAIIPHTESEALAAAAPEGQATLFLANSLAHVRLGPTSILDSVTLWRAVYHLLCERDSAAAPAE